jgi:gluconokinase
MQNLKLVVVGATGSGKTEVGTKLAKKLGIPFVDGDDLHTEANLKKMANGVPLSDEDREPWMANILEALEQPNVVIGASLLKRTHRRKIQKVQPEVRFIQLSAPMRVLQSRIQDRMKFFRQDLLNSQLVVMDPLRRDERGSIYDATQSVNELVKQITFDLVRK